MKFPRTDLIRSRPWNQMEGKVLGSRVWGERESTGESEKELDVGVNIEEVGERDRVRFKCCGTQSLKSRLDRSDRFLRPVRPVGLRLTGKLFYLTVCGLTRN